MRRRKESAIEILIRLPWWVSVLIGCVAFVGLRWVIPSMLEGKVVATAFIGAARLSAPWVGLLFAFTAGAAALFARRKRHLLDQQMTLATIRELDWQEFEWMVGEAYRRQGYTVQDSIKRGPDGGIDLVLRKNGETVLVQCKQRRSSSVGAPVVREAYGVQMHEKADRSVVITSGHFTREAVTFAQGKPIELIDGPELLALVRDVQLREKPAADATQPPPATTKAPAPVAPATVSSPIPCPQCGAPMVLRTARRGANAGSTFWGCCKYPSCRGTLDRAGA
jgi:restriction system protein